MVTEYLKPDEMKESEIGKIISAWVPGLKTAKYKILRTIGNVDLAVIHTKSKKEYLISRYQIEK